MWGYRTLGVACGPTGVAGVGGPGRCVCRWAAARPRAVRAASFARRVVSLSGQALPPPMGTPAVPSGPSNVVCFVVLRFGDAPMRVVTNVVNRRCFSCGFLIRCYKRRQSDGFFAENQGFWTQIDDVCNMSTRKGGSNCFGLTTFVTLAAHRSLSQAGMPPPHS